MRVNIDHRIQFKVKYDNTEHFLVFQKFYSSFVSLFMCLSATVSEFGMICKTFKNMNRLHKLRDNNVCWY